MNIFDRNDRGIMALQNMRWTVRRPYPNLQAQVDEANLMSATYVAEEFNVDAYSGSQYSIGFRQFEPVSFKEGSLMVPWDSINRRPRFVS